MYSLVYPTGDHGNVCVRLEQCPRTLNHRVLRHKSDVAPSNGALCRERNRRNCTALGWAEKQAPRVCDLGALQPV